MQYEAPRTIFTWKDLEVSAYRWNSWEASDGNLGSAARTPWGAIRRQREWRDRLRFSEDFMWKLRHDQ